MSAGTEAIGLRLNELLANAGLDSLGPALTLRFQDYFSLLIRWNARVNLTAIRDPDGILSRHFVESIACARALPEGIRTLLDFGSGAGIPGIPIALCRPEISVTLAESQGKKAAFLQEAARVLGLSTKVYSRRGESLTAYFDCVTLRAVDRMRYAVQAATRLVAPGGWLAVMTTSLELANVQTSAGEIIDWGDPLPLPGGDDRVLALGKQGIRVPV
jgi:16S rRNA (guanine527-N7)-methyltransferase